MVLHLNDKYGIKYIMRDSRLDEIERQKPQFCHIAPTPHLDLVDGRYVHLVLAHLIEEDQSYIDFYLEQKEKYNCTIIMDNSAFEMYKQGRPMYDSDKLITMGNGSVRTTSSCQTIQAKNQQRLSKLQNVWDQRSKKKASKRFTFRKAK